MLCLCKCNNADCTSLAFLLTHMVLRGVPLHAGYAQRIAKGDFNITPEKLGFAIDGGIKDATHITQLGKDSGVPVPVAEVVLGHLQKARAQLGPDVDWGAIAAIIRQQASLPSWTPPSGD